MKFQGFPMVLLHLSHKWNTPGSLKEGKHLGIYKNTKCKKILETNSQCLGCRCNVNHKKRYDEDLPTHEAFCCRRQLHLYACELSTVLLSMIMFNQISDPIALDLCQRSHILYANMGARRNGVYFEYIPSGNRHDSWNESDLLQTWHTDSEKGL